MCDSWSDEACEVWNERTKKARKPHKCTGCGEVIAASHRYRHTTTIFDGCVSVYKHCLRCAAIVDALKDRLDPERFTEETLFLNCGEVWDDPPPEIAALAFWTPGELLVEVAR